MKRIIAKVTGRVQGVGYRYFVTDGAIKFKISGYVRNMPEGSVQVVAEAGESLLLQFIRYLYAEGDPVICVTGLNVEWSTATGEFTEFVIRR